MRRVKDMNPNNQSELFTAYRYHAVFTNSPLPMLEAEKAHRAHAIVEQVIADLKNGPLAHLPSGHFWANSAWLVCAAMAFNLTRAAGTLASTFHANATTGTIRAQLITVPGRLARSARRLTLHLPTAGPGRQAWEQLAHRLGERPTARRPDPSTRPTGPDRRPRGEQPARPATSACTTPSTHPPDRTLNSPTEVATVDPGLAVRPDVWDAAQVLITNHVLSGAVVGALTRDPVRAFGRGFLSHFVLDALPHFGLDEEHLMKVAVPDGLLGLAAIGLVVRETPRHLVLPVLAGIAGACLPDMDKPGQQFFDRSPFPPWFDRVHAAIQPEASHRMPIELAAAAIFAGALSVLLGRDRRQQPRTPVSAPAAPRAAR